jgi:hypothetical protein
MIIVSMKVKARNADYQRIISNIISNTQKRWLRKDFLRCNQLRQTNKFLKKDLLTFTEPLPSDSGLVDQVGLDWSDRRIVMILLIRFLI